MKSVKIFLQRIYIAFKLYLKNGIANHAAACAYAFLLSMAPTLLLISYIIFITFHSSPRTISALLNSIPVINSLFDETWLTSGLFTLSAPSIPTIIFIISIIWAGRILALSLQRGLKIIFPSEININPIKNTLITFIIEGALIVFILILIGLSRTAIGFFRLLEVLPGNSIFRVITSYLGAQVLYISLLGFASFLAYRFVPVNPPRRFSAFLGSILCSFSFFAVSFALNILLDQGRYHFLYGTFGNIIIMLVNVYFFFMFFFIGAQFAFVRDNYIELPNVFVHPKKGRYN